MQKKLEKLLFYWRPLEEKTKWNAPRNKVLRKATSQMPIQMFFQQSAKHWITASFWNSASPISHLDLGSTSRQYRFDNVRTHLTTYNVPSLQFEKDQFRDRPKAEAIGQNLFLVKINYFRNVFLVSSISPKKRTKTSQTEVSQQ